MEVQDWDGKYIKFDSVSTKEDAEYTKGIFDGLGYAMSRVRLYPEAHNAIRFAVNRLKESYRSQPHYHYSSILGPFCAACGCNLPGPNGEWE